MRQGVSKHLTPSDSPPLICLSHSGSLIPASVCPEPCTQAGTSIRAGSLAVLDHPGSLRHFLSAGGCWPRPSLRQQTGPCPEVPEPPRRPARRLDRLTAPTSGLPPHPAKLLPLLSVLGDTQPVQACEAGEGGWGIFCPAAYPRSPPGCPSLQEPTAHFLCTSAPRADETPGTEQSSPCTEVGPRTPSTEGKGPVHLHALTWKWLKAG